MEGKKNYLKSLYNEIKMAKHLVFNFVFSISHYTHVMSYNNNGWMK